MLSYTPRVMKAGTNSVHLVGIGGVGMSALAQALLDGGATVSGSDRLLDGGDATETLQCLQRQGVALYPQDGSAIRPGLSRLVVSSAIEPGNPDLLAAKRHNVPVVHRARELADLTAERRLIAVTGTSGKSSVTAMLAWLLAEAGLDPQVINGAAVCGWDAQGARIGSVRAGHGDWAVIEADESDRSLLGFAPAHAIITNRSADHFDAAETDRIFDAFRGRVGGTVIEDQPPDDVLLPARGWHSGFRFEGVAFEIPLPGRHNGCNAWQAVRMAHALGLEAHTLARALARFPGVERRLQRVGVCGGATVIDDYAHNPAKLAAAWQTVAGVFPRIAGVWRPHGYAPLRNNLDELAATFIRSVRPQDRLYVLPVYDAGGTARRDVNAHDLVARLTPCGVSATVVPDLATAEARLRIDAQAATALLVCGARDPGLPRLARRLAS